MRKLFLLLTCIALTANAQINQIVGDWLTVDDQTGDNYSVVTIYQGDNGLYYGKITQMLFPGTENFVCEQCEGADKNQPILGMVIIRDMVNKNGVLQGGKVLDPNNGKFYYGKISIDNGKLRLRGSLDKAGILGRSQHWIRKTDNKD